MQTMLPVIETQQTLRSAGLGGAQISALDVERALCRHRDVRAAAVAPAPLAAQEAEVLACVVLRERHSVQAQQALAEEITRFAMYHVAYYEAPGFVAFVDDLPAQVDRRRLGTYVQALSGTPACMDIRPIKRRWIDGACTPAPLAVPPDGSPNESLT